MILILHEGRQRGGIMCYYQAEEGRSVGIGTRIDTKVTMRRDMNLLTRLTRREGVEEFGMKQERK